MLGTPRPVDRGGFTLVEVLAASVVASVLAGGTLAAYIAASRMAARGVDHMARIEAEGYAQETLEKFRNHVAADDNWVAINADGLWHDDILPGGGGSESIFSPTVSPLGVRRCYRVTPENCGGGPGDCYAVQARVCWGTDITGCNVC